MKSRIIILLISLIYSGIFCFSQTFTNTASHNFTNSTPYTTTYTVSGVSPGKILRQITLKFGDGAMYSGDLSKTTITLKNPAGDVVTLINPANFGNTSNSANKYLNITLRDNSALYTPGQWVTATGNFLSMAYPFNYGYWKSVGSYSSFSGTNNGTWELEIINTSGGSARKYISSELVFGDDFDYVDIRTTKPNQSCATKECMQTGTIYLATNSGYPNGQSNIPLNVGSCTVWNAAKNNSAWFYFTASGPTVDLSISGMSKKIESVVAVSSDCNNYTLANGGCPSEMYNSSGNFTQYYQQTYAGGYSQNHGYHLTGLTVGQEYILILDGLDGSPPTESNFYIEIESGADDGCCPIINLTALTTETDCTANTGTISLTPTGGASPYTYDFDDGNGFVSSNIANGLAAGTYNVVIKDVNGCKKDTAIVVKSAAQPIIDNIDITDVSCGNSNGVIVVTASGGTGTIKYSSNGGATTQPSGTFSNLPPGSISISVLDDNCQKDTTIMIGNDGTAVPNQPSAIVGDITVCSGGSKNYSVTNVSGVNYAWTYSGGGTVTGSGSSISLTNITSNGTLTVTPSNGCGDGTPQTVNITVTDVPNQPSVITGPISLACGDSTANYSVVNAGVTYTWTYSGTGTVSGSGNAITLNNIASGGTLTVTPSNSCGNGTPQTITISIASGPTIDNISTTDPSCGASDGVITITVSGGTSPYNFSIGNGSDQQSIAITAFSGLSTGTYTIVVTDDNGCTATQTESLSNVGAPIIGSIVATQTSCIANDGTITITATGAGTLEYSIDNGVTYQGTGLFTGLGAGIYSISVKDANGCVATGTTTITQMNAPDLTLVNSTNVTCSGNDDGSIEVLATGGTGTLTYSWSPNVSTTEAATNLAAGVYTITVTDGVGCTDDLQVTISESNAIAIVETITDANCGLSNGSISLQVTGGALPYIYNWDSGFSMGLKAGNYEVTITDANGCTQTGSYTVGTTGSFNLEIVPEHITIHQGEDIDIHLTIDPNITVDSIVWSPAEGLSCTDCKNPVAAPETTTTYYVEVFSDDGCSAMDSIVITVKSPCSKIYVPTSFSPNGDGMNDIQCVMGDCIVTMDFTIFDRWGEVVFQTADQKECWDGLFRGKLVQSGVYVYKLKATLDNGEKIEESGNINVVR